MSRSSAARRNVELKAIDPDPERSLRVCRELGAADHGVIHQRDTYFNAVHGVLKLREDPAAVAQLIHYERDDRTEQRLSRYRIVEVPDGETLRAALGTALGVRGVVEKRRHLWLWDQVRIHLDDVSSLGHFIEFEAVAPAESDLSEQHRRVAELRVAFEIDDDRLCPTGYATLSAFAT
ncbi:MAG TPA: class IV adenylate cyclase [Solirubrobacteraceae bacterium]|nr:class IV adenylate cyclase [Solirubrobacteraceae bacterium]